ncbi:MAG: septum formation initiator family protein [Actinomycetia bacterium]|nr:septum formation initiator family protein [Actinomycetes bacterium]
MTDTLAPPQSTGKRRRPRARRSRIGSLIFVVLLVALGLVATGVLPVRDYLERENAVNAAQTRLEVLQTDNAELAADVDALFSEQEIERIAREQYGFVRPGEIGYVVLTPDEPFATVPTADPVVAATDDRSLLQTIWDFVTGNDISTGDG